MEELPSVARLQMSHSRRLRALSAKAWQSYDRAYKRGDKDAARAAMQDHKALEAAADMMRDAAMARAKATGEALT